MLLARVLVFGVTVTAEGTVPVVCSSNQKIAVHYESDFNHELRARNADHSHLKSSTFPCVARKERPLSGDTGSEQLEDIGIDRRWVERFVERGCYCAVVLNTTSTQ